MKLSTHMVHRRSHEKGFTLVEIAIVLVIIGLLLGGILKGQEMITQAKIKNVVNDFNGITAAVYSYQDRYRALAGDDPGATRWTGGIAGNGNGVLDTAQGVAAYKYGGVAPVATEETLLFWQDLRFAGFVPGVTTGAQAGSPPTNAVNGITGVQTGAGATTLGFASNIVCTTNLPDKIAISVDTQMDDGSMQTGQLRSTGPQTQPNPNLAALPGGTLNYVEDGVSQYTICKAL